LDAAELSPRFLPAITTIEKAVFMNASVVVIGDHLITFPDFFDIILADTQQNRTGSVACGEKHLIFDDEGCCGRDRGAVSRTPRFLETNIPGLRINRNKTIHRKEEDRASPVNGRGHRRRITGLFTLGPPHLFAGVLVEGEHAATRRTDIYQ